MRAKQGLTKSGFKRPNWSHLGRGTKRDGEREEEEEEEEEKKRKRGSSQKGMDITLDMISIMNHMDFVWDSRKVYEFQI